MPTYLALGDSMSIDLYTGKVGGGAVNQFHEMLGLEWRLIDETEDGETMPFIPTDIRADRIRATRPIRSNFVLVRPSAAS